MKGWIWVAVLSMLAAPALADPVADARAHSEAFAAAMNARDADAALALYAKKAHVIWPGQGEVAHGKAEIAKLITAAVKAMGDAKIALVSQDVVPLDDEYMAVVGRWEQRGPGPDGKVRTTPVRTTEIIRKRNGRMRYVVDHASVGAPPPSAPDSR